MPDPARPSASRAVFLSYTTEDVAIALAVCEALREAEIEVWMDQSELQGGDAWDENIQRQIRECALIIPIISARTQARREGYFRLEWRLADERMRLVAEGTPLIVPVVADDTRQADALVPKSFLTVQWSRLPHGHVPPALVLRVRKLLGFESPEVSATLPPVAISALPAACTGPREDEPAIGSRNDKTGAPASLFWRRPLPVALMTAAVTSLVVGMAVWKIRPAPAPDAEPPPVVRISHSLPPGVSFPDSARPLAALSPDGQSVAYSTTTGLFIRRLSEFNAHLLVGAEQTPRDPTFSVDGQWVVFSSTATRQLYKISVNGGAAVRIGSGWRSGARSEAQGVILYSQADGIWREPADGDGKPERVISAEADERLAAPQLLPGGKYVVFHSRRADGEHVEVGSLSGGARKVVVPGGRSAHYVSATGHLLYMVESDLIGVAFDVERLATIGNPVSLVQGVRLGGTNRTPTYAVSRSGTLLYLTAAIDLRVPVWVDRQGKEKPVNLEPSGCYSARLSPDGTKVLLTEVAGGKFGFLVWDFAGETRTRLTQVEPNVPAPIWTPDGLRVVYSHFDGRLMVKPANNTRPPEEFLAGRDYAGTHPLFFTADGRKLIFYSSTGLRSGLGSISVGATEKPTWLLKQAGRGAALSPDGKWIAYQSSESGSEVYVSPFPNVTDDRVPVSQEGGAHPLWSRDGKEIFYVGLNENVLPAPLMAATVQTEGGKITVVARKPVWNPTPPYFTTPMATHFRNYDLSPDGQRFIVLKDVTPEAAADASGQIVIVKNWTEELKRRVPWPKK